MARRVKDKKAAEASDLPRLAPEDAAALEAMIGRVAESLAAGADLEALKSLVETRPQDLAWDQHLIAALGALPSPAVAQLLAALFAAAPDKARRKALKRAFHALRSRGVAAPPDLLPREEGLQVRETGAGPQAHVSQVLGNGERYVVLEGPRDILGGNILVARLHDQEGFRECHVFDLKSKGRQEFWDTLTKDGLIDTQPAPVPYALRLLEEAYQAHPQKDGAPAYASVRERVLAPWGREEPPELDLLLGEITPAERSRLLDESRQLAQDPLFYFWIPAADEIAPWFEKLKGILTSPLVLTDPQKKARIDELVNEAARSLFPPETRDGWRRRLRDMAYFLTLKGRKEEARAAAAAADDLAQERSPLLGDAVFLKVLTTLALRLAYDMEGKEEGESPWSLLAPPTEPLILRR
ncbi:MAG: hypothetical protein FJ134_05840 [Deltaproteobacteria bacterium]|nr:hypothetical protein [Deltaproteobacteria bacterium]